MADVFTNDIEQEFMKLPDRTRQLFWGFLCNANIDWYFFFSLYDFESFVCDSPIETIFYFAICVTDVRKGFPWSIERQVEIETSGGKYRVDFLISDDNSKVIVECDGHEFHERTKEQVAYGNNRDFNLKLEGYEVIHFSGSQIYNEPLECCVKVSKYFKSKELEFNGQG